MPHNVGKTNTGPGEGHGDNYILPASQFVNGDSARKFSQQSPSPSQNKGNARFRPQGGPVLAITPAADSNSQRSVLANAQPGGFASMPVPPVTNPGAARLRSNAWTPGFERAMQELEAAGRASIPSPDGQGRPISGLNLGGRSVSSAIQEEAASTGHSAARVDTGGIIEGIENAVEQQVADALGPLRLIVNNLAETARVVDTMRQDSLAENSRAVEILRQENADYNEQNDIMSRQIDLHYRDIQQHSDVASTHVRALAGLIEAQSRLDQTASENLSVAGALVGQLSQIVVNIPYSVVQVVHLAVAQTTQCAIKQIMENQQEALDSIRIYFEDQHAHLEYHRVALSQHPGCQDVGIGAPLPPQEQQQQEEQESRGEEPARKSADNKVKAFCNKAFKLGRK